MQNTEHFRPPHERAYPPLVLTIAGLLLSGAIPFLETIPPPSSPEPGQLVINEIHYHPAADHTEFIELYNRSDRSLDLRSLSIADDRRDLVRLEGGPTTLKPGDFAVITRDEAVFQRYFPVLSVHRAHPWPQLNNTGDAVLLFADTTLLDSVRYDPGWGGEKVSLERIDPAGSSTEKDNWHSSIAESGFTPGRRNSVYAPDTIPPQLVFAEELPARAILLHFSEPIVARSIAEAHVSCGADSQIADAHLRPNQRQLHLPLAVPPTARECIAEGIEDLPGNTMTRHAVPLAYLPKSGQLPITEIMYEPLADPFDNRPDQPEYVELYNRSELHLTLRRLYWTDRVDEYQNADTTWIDRPLTAIPPGGYAVVFADPNGAEGETLRRAFPGPTPPVRLLPMPTRSLNLRNEGETIRLHGADNTVIDELRYSSAWHHPDLVERRGIALERIALDGPSNTASNWSSSTDPTGGTPGRPNSVIRPTPVPSREQALDITPSPFSPDGDGYEDHTRIAYHLAAPAASLRLRIFNAKGHLVRSLLKAHLTGPQGTIIWDGRDDHSRLLPAGIYIVLLEIVDASGGATEQYKKPVVLARPS